MTKARQHRNQQIKHEVVKYMETGMNLKQACYAASENPTWGLTYHQVYRIYYDTPMEGKETGQTS